MDNNPTKKNPRHLQEHSFTRRDFISTSLKAGAAAFTTGLIPNLNVNAQGRYNVLFIMVDDLRPLLGCYGHTEMHTPNIDKLATNGTLFNRAYCQYPVCNPSRASILTGLRPETNGVQDNSTDFRDALPDVVSLPQHFKNHGYHSRSIGKVAHGKFAWNDNLSWSAPIWHPKWRPFQGVPSWQALYVEDNELEDGQVAQQTMKVLDEVKDHDFFLAVGFIRPHLPFYAPSKYFDYYDLPNIDNLSDIDLPEAREIRSYSDIPSGNVPLSKEKLAELIRAYSATISYMDAQVGLIIDYLDELNIIDNTVIMFCGDHGYHLGEHGTFGKRTVFEISLHSPLIVNIPDNGNRGNQTDAIVELVDIFPTLCDVCDLTIPSELEGISMLPVIRQPSMKWKTAAFSKIGKENGTRSIRTEQYRYSESGLNGIFGIELYDHNVDVNEKSNIAYLSENAELVSQLSQSLRSGWRDALPTMHNYGHRFSPYDVNEDGVVDMQDLIIISNNFQINNPENPKVDINSDGSVNIIDLLIVAANFSDNAAPQKSNSFDKKCYHLIENWLTEAHQVENRSKINQRGIDTLENLLINHNKIQTTLLPNYPNPFNPETWLPYDLAEDTEVTIQIHNSQGLLIRQLSIGFQSKGIYRNPNRAAYWDGRNSYGESVASGVYFYTMYTGKMKVTRQMVVKK